MQIFRPQTVQQALADVSIAKSGDVVHMPVASVGWLKLGKVAAGVTLQAGTYSKIECASDGVIFDRPVVKATGQGYDSFGIIITGNDCVIKFPTVDNRDGTVWAAGGRYADRLERREGEWKIAFRYTIIEWSGKVDPVEVPLAQNVPDIHGNGVPSRSREDPTYRRPLTNLRELHFPDNPGELGTLAD